MKVLVRQFLGKLHSWSVVGWGLTRSFKTMGHQVDLFSTDGTRFLPSDLQENLIGYTEENQQKVFGRLPDAQYDAQVSYTCMKNFPYYLSSGSKNRLGIWTYEWANGMPTGFAKHYKSCDYLCAPSNFSKRLFIDAGVPENVVKVIPHGIDAKAFQQTTIISLPTNKTFKIGVVLAQNHLRKNIPGLLDAYGKAFINKDDVCLIIKGKNKPVQFPFDVSLNDCIARFQQKYPQHAEVKVFSEFIDDMSDFYRSVDAVYSMSFAEGFYFPGIESLASGKINIVPRWGGQLDFLNDDNALLINGKEGRADPKSMYWESKPSAIWFVPDVNDAVEKIRYAYHNFERLNAGLDKQRQSVYNTYDWKTIAQQFIDLCV